MAGSGVRSWIAARRRMGLTQAGLAARLGMSLRAIQDIESGRAKLRKIHRLAMEQLVHYDFMEREGIDIARYVAARRVELGLPARGASAP